MALKLKISKTLSKLPTVDYRELTPLQGNLKDLSEVNYNKLKKSLTEFGFIVPIFIWKHEGNNFVIDAHQRLRVLTKEKAQPFLIPYVEIEANDEIQARQKLLVISSQYGKITQEGYDEFIVDIPDDFLLETVNFDALYTPVDPDFDNIKSNENREAPKKEQSMECPHCGETINF